MLIVVIIHSNKRADVETRRDETRRTHTYTFTFTLHTLHSIMFILFPYMTKVNGISKWIHEQTQWTGPNTKHCKHKKKKRIRKMNENVKLMVLETKKLQRFHHGPTLNMQKIENFAFSRIFLRPIRYSRFSLFQCKVYTLPS